MIGCAVQTGVGAVLNTARVEPGATVLVLGLGGIGLSVVQGARVAGAARIIASDPLPERRAAAERLGATDVVDPARPTSWPRRIALTEVGVDYAFEAVGRAALGRSASRRSDRAARRCASARRRSTRAFTISPMVLFGIQEKKLVGCLLGSCNSQRDIPRLVALWQAGRLDLEGLITNRRPLADINGAFDDLGAGRGVRTVISMAS